MTGIMKLADDYAAKNRAVANVIEQGTSGELIEADGDKKRARAALQSAIEALQEENALLEGTLESRGRNIAALQAENERLNKNNGLIYVEVLQLRNERDALQSKVNAMGKGEAVGEWKHCSPELLASGVSCRDTPRRPCECDHGGSHDHWIAAPKALAPLTQTEVVDAFCNTRHNTHYVSVFDAGVRFAEKHHGIGGTP